MSSSFAVARLILHIDIFRYLAPLLYIDVAAAPRLRARQEAFTAAA